MHCDPVTLPRQGRWKAALVEFAEHPGFIMPSLLGAHLVSELHHTSGPPKVHGGEQIGPSILPFVHPVFIKHLLALSCSQRTEKLLPEHSSWEKVGKT